MSKKIEAMKIMSKIEIENLKSISNIKIECKPFNLFIGENGTGKSSVLEAIGFLLQSLGNPIISGHLTDWGSMVKIFREKKFDIPIKFHAEFQIPFSLYSEQGIDYLFANRLSYDVLIEKLISTQSEQNFQISALGELFYNGESITPKWYGEAIYNQKGDVKGSSLNASELNKSFDSIFKDAIETNELTGNFKGGSYGGSSGLWDINIQKNLVNESQIIDKLSFNLGEHRPFARKIPANRLISKWFFDYEDTSPKYINLEDNGQSLSTFLLYFLDREFEDFWKKLQNWLEFFDLSNFKITPKPNKLLALDIVDKNLDVTVDINAIGSGMNQLIGLIISCLLAKEGEILLIEEPEIHLHPKYQAKITDLLIETVKRGIQIFVTTHSEYMLLRLQRKIAEGLITSNSVGIYEFKRKQGVSTSIPTKLDEKGYFIDGLPTFLEHSKEEFKALEKNLRD